MANNEIKTNAEIYREQRKERLAKAQKKKSGKGDKIIRILVKTICILLIAGVVLYSAGNIVTKVFCLPQKLLTVATYEDEKINVAEYNYYYMTLYNQIANYTQQIDSYYGAGYGSYVTGFDMTVDPAEQEYKGDDAPEGVETWSDYFRLMAPEKAVIQRELYAEAMSEEAKAAGFEISEEKQEEFDKTVDEAINQFTTNAEKEDFSLDNYISRACGEGLTEKSYREIYNRDLVVDYYLTWYQENLADTTTADDVKAYYNEHKADFDMVDARIFEISYAEPDKDADKKDPTYTKAQAKARAEEFQSKITDSTSFYTLAKEYALPSQKDTFSKDSATLASKVTKTTIQTEAVAKWLFDDARKVGDSTVINDAELEAYYVVYLVTAAAPDRQTAGADVRHILVQVDTKAQDSEGNDLKLSDEKIQEDFDKAKKEAEEILKEWKKGKATEESFAALATEKTDDTGSKETGGLYEDITSTSNYVPEFLNWALEPHKVGDTGIIRTDYGYHIMYFVGADKTEKWEKDVRNTIASEGFNDYSTKLYEDVSEKIEKSETIINFFVKTNEKTILNYAAYYASTAASSSSSSSSSISF